MADPKAKPDVVEVKAIEATAESFEEYGQVIGASPDGDEFGPQDAQLDLSRGIPRYILFFSMIHSGLYSNGLKLKLFIQFSMQYEKNTFNFVNISIKIFVKIL